MLIPSLPPGLNAWIMRPLAGQRNSGFAFSVAGDFDCSAAEGAWLAAPPLTAPDASSFAVCTVPCLERTAIEAGAAAVEANFCEAASADSAWLAIVRGGVPKTLAAA